LQAVLQHGLDLMGGGLSVHFITKKVFAEYKWEKIPY